MTYSNCCGAEVKGDMLDFDLCPECKEHCEFETDEEITMYAPIRNLRVEPVTLTELDPEGATQCQTKEGKRYIANTTLFKTEIEAWKWLEERQTIFLSATKRRIKELEAI